MGALAKGGYGVVEVRPGSAERAPVAAADVVLAFSRTAAVQDAPDELPTGRYWYDRTTSTNLDEDVDGRPVRSEATYERWIAADGTGRTVNRVAGFGPPELIHDGPVLAEPAPPALRAALFEVLARIPGITVETGVTDRLGRVATAVPLDDTEPGHHRQVIVDPATSTLLGRRDSQLAPAASSPASPAVATRVPAEPGA